MTTPTSTSQRSRRRSLTAFGAALATVGGALALTAPVQAGATQTVASVEITIYVFDPDDGAQAIADALTPELFTDPGGQNVIPTMCMTAPPGTVESASERTITIDCTLPLDSSYRLGSANPPAGFSANIAFCRGLDESTEALPGDDASIALTAAGAECTLVISPTPTLYVDKVVAGEGATASAADFPIEIYRADGGAQVDIGTVNDPSDALCSIDDQTGDILNPENCLAIPLANGFYTMGEVLPTYGYDASDLDCRPLTERVVIDEALDSDDFGFAHSAKTGNTYCALTNRFGTARLQVDLVLINDSGRDASGSDFTIEVYDNAGVLVDSAPDPEPGVDNLPAVFELPIGPYTLGFSGPDGYDATAQVVAFEAGAEQIDSPDAQFTLGEGGARATITLDDQTIVTTTAAPTTVAPTTAAPVVTVDPNAVLPATGSNSTTWPMMLLALGLMAFGGATVAATRRH